MISSRSEGVIGKVICRRSGVLDKCRVKQPDHRRTDGYMHQHAKSAGLVLHSEQNVFCSSILLIIGLIKKTNLYKFVISARFPKGNLCDDFMSFYDTSFGE